LYTSVVSRVPVTLAVIPLSKTAFCSCINCLFSFMFFSSSIGYFSRAAMSCFKVAFSISVRPLCNTSSIFSRVSRPEESSLTLNLLLRPPEMIASLKYLP
jgi:hypothetical protein